MKNLDEVKKYVFNIGHDQESIAKIEGFLIGNGVLSGDFEMEYMVGDNRFNDFKDWFDGNKAQPIDDEFGYGDFIHVDDVTGDVLCLSDVYNGKFIGTSGENIAQFSMNDSSRPCNEQEIDNILKVLRTHGVGFLFSADEFVPCSHENEGYKKIDELEIQSKEAIENITAALLSNEIDKDEREMVIQAMCTLVELGKMYE